MPVLSMDAERSLGSEPNAQMKLVTDDVTATEFVGALNEQFRASG